MLDDAKRSHAQTKEDKAPTLEARAKAKAPTPEAGAKAKAYRQKARAKKFAEESARIAWLNSAEGQAEAKAARRAEFIGDNISWGLETPTERSKPYLQFITEDAQVWRYTFRSDTTAYVYPTALGWEGSFRVEWDEAHAIRSEVAFDTADGAKGWVYDVYRGPAGNGVGGLYRGPSLSRWAAGAHRHQAATVRER